MGKTRLGIEVAAIQQSNFTDGLVYVPLASIAGPDSTTEINPLAGAMADALKISFHGGAPPEEQLINYLKRKEMLLILDNFEHLLATAALVGDLLAQAPDIKIVVTSRERLNLLEEWRFPLEGLHFSETQETQQAGADNSAVQLFGQTRASSSKPSFDLDSELPAVLQICRLVEGMPLALELAAAWIHQMPCAVIVEEIEAEIDFLTTNLRNIPERHRSMRAVFGYSWEKLTDREKDVLQKLSVFRGGFERNAAGVVTGASLGLLSGLVDKSLLSIAEDGRYQIHELLRQFIAEKLAQSSVAENDALQRHSHFYITVFGEQEPKLQGPEGPGLMTAFERDIDNIRVAIRRAVSHQPQLFDKSFGHTLWHFCEVRGWHLEGEAIFSQISTRLKGLCQQGHAGYGQTTTSPECLLWALYNSYVAWFQMRLGRLQMAEEIGRASLGVLPSEDPTTHWTRGQCLFGLGINATIASQYSQAKSYFKEAIDLQKMAGNFWDVAFNLITLGQVLQQTGDFEEAQALAEEGERQLDRMDDQLWIGHALGDLGRVAAHQGDLAEAERFHQMALAQRSRVGLEGGIAFSLRDLGEVAYLKGEYENAQDYFEQSIATANKINMPHTANESLWGIGKLALAAGDFTAAKRYFAQSGRVKRRARCLVGGPAWAALGLGELAEAKRLFQDDLLYMLDTDSKPVGLDALVGIAHLESQAGRVSRALELLTLVKHHSASTYETREKASKMWDELAAELSPDVVAEAEVRGRELNLWETAMELAGVDRSLFCSRSITVGAGLAPLTPTNRSRFAGIARYPI